LGIGSLGFIVEYELSSSARERLEQQAGRVAAVDEGTEVLPVGEEEVLDDAVVVAADAEQDEALSVIDEDTELAPEQEEKSDPGSDPAAGEEEPLPILDDQPADWHVPQTSALRELLSEMEAPKSRRRHER
jgi:hypothetical protein